MKIVNKIPAAKLPAQTDQVVKMFKAANKPIMEDVKKAARQVEEVFVNELMKSLFQNTELGKEKVVSDYLPVITNEITKSVTQRGIGIQDFLLRSPSFVSQIENQGAAGKKLLPVQELKMPNNRSVSKSYQEVMGLGE